VLRRSLFTPGRERIGTPDLLFPCLQSLFLFNLLKRPSLSSEPTSCLSIYSTMDLQELVRTFDKLPRSPKTPSGLVDDHWHIAIRHVPLEPPGDLLHLVNPGSQYTHSEGPAQILSVEPATSRADVVLPMLLRSFVNNMGERDPRVTPRGGELETKN
jgi:hypothetical protein